MAWWNNQDKTEEAAATLPPMQNEPDQDERDAEQARRFREDAERRREEEGKK